MSHRENIAKLVKTRRKELGITTRFLAKMCEDSGHNINIRDISHLESGKVNMGIDNLFLIFEKLNIDLSKLYNQ